MHLPKLIGTDIDGVWTDGGMYYDNCGNESKRFCTIDGMAVAMCRHARIPIAVITGEDTLIVANRAKKLQVDLVFQGVQNKKQCMIELIRNLRIEMHEVAYIGDDLNDIALLQSVGFSGCPSNANQRVRSLVDFVVPCQGGHGAFRGFVEHILKEAGILDDVICRMYPNDEPAKPIQTPPVDVLR